jgi:FkbM family methyltransferase
MDHLLRLNFRPQTIVDVGIAYGTPGLYGKFKGVKYLLVEPLHEYKGILTKICSEYDAEYVIAAASSRPGKITLNVHPDLSGSSLYNETEGNHVDGTPREVLAVTIDGLCREKKLNGPYIVKIDVQGAELDVLAGASQVLLETEIIILEVSLFQFFKNGPQFYDVVNFMKKQGFVVYDIFGGHNRLLDNALGQIDIVFTKENGFFRKSHDFASKEQREEFTRKRKRHLNPKK